MRAERDIVMALNSSVCLSNARVVSKRIHISSQFWWSGKDIIPYSPTRVYDSLTSRGDAFDAWLTTSWGMQTRVAAQRPSKGVSVDAWRECGGGGVEQAAKSVKTEQEMHACRWIFKQQNYAH